MAKTKEQLVSLKQEYESLTNKLKELTDDELKLVLGGVGVDTKSADYDDKTKPNPYVMAA